jgi:replicative DNA helicase
MFGVRVAQLYGLWCDCSSQGGHLTYYCQRVHEQYRRHHAAMEIAVTADEMRGTDDVDAVLDHLPEIASKYAPALENRAAENSAVIQDILAELEGKKQNDHFRFGIEALDQILDGVPPTTLTTVGARSSNGKSVFLGQAAINCAARAAQPALMFSIEMSQKELFKRWAAHLSRQPIRGGDRRAFIGGLSRVDQLQRDGLLHVFTGPHTVEQIAAEAMAFASRSKLGIIVVDYLQAVVSTKSRTESREQQVAHIAGSLKHLASKAGAPVLTASQLNKDGENNPRGSTLRESEAIFNYSNIVLLLDPAKGSEREDAADMDIIIDKNRDGKKDVVVARWEKPIYTIRDQDACDLPNYRPELV